MLTANFNDFTLAYYKCLFISVLKVVLHSKTYDDYLHHDIIGNISFISKLFIIKTWYLCRIWSTYYLLLITDQISYNLESIFIDNHDTFSNQLLFH